MDASIGAFEFVGDALGPGNRFGEAPPIVLDRGNFPHPQHPGLEARVVGESDPGDPCQWHMTDCREVGHADIATEKVPFSELAFQNFEQRAKLGDRRIFHREVAAQLTEEIAEGHRIEAAIAQVIEVCASAPVRTDGAGTGADSETHLRDTRR